MVLEVSEVKRASGAGVLPKSYVVGFQIFEVLSRVKTRCTTAHS